MSLSNDSVTDNISLALTYNDVLLVPQRSKVFSRSLVDLKTSITPNIQINFPVISVNMDTVTNVSVASQMAKFGGLSFYPRFLPPKDQAKQVKEILEKGYIVIPAIGIKEVEYDRVTALLDVGVTAVTIDVAHGHLEKSLDMIKTLKRDFKGLEIIAGVIGTYEGAKDLFQAGADAIRVGVGPGTICTTRQVTGCGVPQITAIMEASRAGREFGLPVIADGGTKSSGDIVKALAAGANAVVVGSQLAGCKESPGSIVNINGVACKEYNGSTSKKEKLRQYRAYSKDKNKTYIDYVEGQEAYVKYQGPIIDVLARMEKGIRSGFSYCNAFNIKELHKNAKFIRVTNTSIAENGTHGVFVN